MIIFPPNSKKFHQTDLETLRKEINMKKRFALLLLLSSISQAAFADGSNSIPLRGIPIAKSKSDTVIGLTIKYQLINEAGKYCEVLQFRKFPEELNYPIEVSSAGKPMAVNSSFTGGSLNEYEVCAQANGDLSAEIKKTFSFLLEKFPNLDLTSSRDQAYWNDLDHEWAYSTVSYLTPMGLVPAKKNGRQTGDQFEELQLAIQNYEKTINLQGNQKSRYLFSERAIGLSKYFQIGCLMICSDERLIFTIGQTERLLLDDVLRNVNAVSIKKLEELKQAFISKSIAKQEALESFQSIMSDVEEALVEIRKADK